MIMRYQLNLVRELRKREGKTSRDRTRVLLLALVCFAVCALAVLYEMLTVFQMQQVLRNQRDNLARIEAEYRKYKETRMIVDKADIELLDKLQNGRVFWTRKLASMALHLPDNYWITAFGYEDSTYLVSGYGYISPEQEQLITLDDYLNLLRGDSTYNDNFPVTFLNATEREDEYGRQRVSFKYSSPKAGRPQ